MQPVHVGAQYERSPAVRLWLSEQERISVIADAPILIAMLLTSLIRLSMPEKVFPTFWQHLSMSLGT